MLAVAASADPTTVTVGNATATVINGAGTSLSFPLTRSGDTSYGAAVRYTTQDGDAAAGTDYSATQGVITIPAGATTANVSVPVTGRSGALPDKQMYLQLLNAAGIGPTVSFAAQQTFAIGNGGIDVLAGDLNGDGRLDLVVSNYTGNTLSVLFNTTAPGATTPSFAPQQPFAVGSFPALLSLADINGDGRTDLIVANSQSHTVSVLLNTTAPGATTPSFSAQQAFATGTSPNQVAVRDLNGDGKPDLVTTNQNSSSVSVLLNTTVPGAATASFAAQQSFATGAVPQSVAAGDVNGDGRPDLVVANRNTNSVSVLLNTTSFGAASPSFAAQQVFSVGAGPGRLSLGDINGDGKLDVVVSNQNGNTTSVLLNTATPGTATAAFSSQQVYATGTGPIALSTADVNGDGKLDLLVASRGTNSALVLLNTTAPGAASSSFAPAQAFAAGSEVSAVIAADFNGDGKQDLVVSNANTISVLLNTTSFSAGAIPASGFSSPQGFVAGTNPFSITAADINGDGRPDVLVPNDGGGTVSVLMNTTAPGATTPTLAAAQSFIVGAHPHWVTAADVNNDGKLDLLVPNYGPGANANNVSVLIGTTAPGAATPSFNAQILIPVGNYPDHVTATDVNGDGRLDLVVTSNIDNNVSVLLNTTPAGTATPSFGPRQTFPVGTTPIMTKTVDVNGDGRPDIEVANITSGTVGVLINTTPVGATTASFSAQTTFASGGNPRSLESSDLNGDGRPDLVVANGRAASFAVFLNTTAAGAAVPSFTTQTLAATPAAYFAETADVNGDGRPDVILTDANTSVASVALNLTAPGAASASFGPLQTYTTGASFGNVIAAIDMNGDGQLDLLTSNPNSPANNISVLLNTQYAARASATLGTGTIRYAATAPPTTPVGVAAVAGNATVTLSWTATAGAASYNVYRATTAGGEGTTALLSNITATSVQVTGLTNGTTYYFKIAAVNTSGTSPQSLEVMAIPAVPPVAPTGVIATPGAQRVTLTWAAVGGASSYRVFQGTAAGGEAATPVATISTTSVILSGLSNGTAYFYRVAAVNSGGQGASSAEVSATPSAALAAPTGVSATAGDGSITLTSNAVSGASSYKIYQGLTPGGEATKPVLSNVSATTVTLAGLANGTRYYFKIAAFSSSGTGAQSAEVNAQPLAVPTPPTGVNAVPGNASATISWSPVAGATGYNVYVATSSGGEVFVAGKPVKAATAAKPGPSTAAVRNAGTGAKATRRVFLKSATAGGPVSADTGPISGTSVTVTGLSNGTVYYFQVTAFNASGESDPSLEVFCTPSVPAAIPPAPTAALATAGNGQIVLTWTASAGAASYNVYQGTTANGEAATPVLMNITTTTATVTGLVNGTTYFFKIAAVNTAGVSPQSNETSAAPVAPLPPPPLAPTSVGAGPGNGQIVLTWTASAGAVSYNVYQGTTANGELATPALTNITTTTATITGLTNGTTYFFKIAAVNTGGVSPQSLEVSKAPAAPVAAPLAPTAALATAGNGQVVLTWTAAAGAVSYNVYQGTAANGEAATPVLTNVTTTTATVIGLVNGTTYFFKIAAVNTGGVSPQSNETSATPNAGLAAPSNVTATASGNGQVKLAWTLVPGAATYNVYQGTAAGAESPTPVKTGITVGMSSLSGLTNNRTYYFTIVALNTGGTVMSPASAEVFAKPVAAPIAPATVSATAGNGQISLSWAASANALSYNVYQGTASNGEAATAVQTGITGTTTTITGLSNGTAYFFKIAAVNGTGTSAQSTAEATATPVAPVTPPPAPTAALATAGNGQVVLTWTGSAGAVSYNVYQGTTANGEAATPVLMNITTTTATVTGLVNGTTYFFKIAAVNTAGVSPQSNETSAAPVAPLPPPPLAPTSVGAGPGNGQIVLTWTASAGAVSYNVYQGTTANGELATPALTNITTTTATVTGLVNGTTYYFKIAAVNAGGVSPQSLEVSTAPVAPVTPPAAPTGVQAAAGNGQVVLSWTAPAGGAASYNIYQGTSANGEAATPVLTSVTATTATITGLTNGTTYFFKVASVNGGGVGPQSLEVSAVPNAGLAAPSNVTATASGNGQVKLTWTLVPGAATYNVYQGTAAGAESPTPVKTGITVGMSSLSGLTNNRTYYFTIVALNTGGTVMSPASAEVFAKPVAAPIAPATVSATAGNGQISLSWAVSANALSYNVYQGTTTNGEAATAVQTGITGTTTTITGLSNGTAYFFKIAAINGSGTSAQSTAEATATPAVPVTPPPAPTAALATAGNGQVVLTWTGSAGAASYNVYQGTTANGEAATPVLMNITTTTATVTGLVNGTTYYFKIAAVNAGGVSPQSLEVSTAPVAPVTPPAAPTGVQAAAGNGQVVLTWTASAGAVSYNVYQGTTANGEAATPVLMNITTTTATISGLTNGTTYFFKIAAVNTGGVSPQSLEVSKAPVAPIAPPPAPTAALATAGNGQVVLTWTGSAGAASYNVYQGTTANGEAAAPVQTNITATTATVTGLVNGTTYFFKIAAVNTGGISPLSNETSTAPAAPGAPLTAPTNVAITPGEASATLTWSAVSGAAKYNIYRGTTAGGEGANPVMTVNSSTATVTGLLDGTVYYFKIAAVSGSVVSPLSAEVSTQPGLQYNQPLPISGAVNSQTLYAVTVPAGAQYLSITLTGPASAATAYVRYGEKPDTNGGYDSQCESDPSATPVAYQCTYYFPYNQTQAGTYYVLVKGNTAYSGVVLKATWDNYVAGDLGFKTTTYYVTEPTTGPASAAITVQRLHGSTGAVGLTLTTSNGTATAGSDYTATTQTVTWADGDSADKTVMIPILADAVFDSGETVNLKVGSYTGGAGVAGSGVLMDAVLTIIDNNAYLSYNTPRTISGAVNSQTLYAVTVPAGAQYLSITLTGPASAATAYVRYGEKPDTNGGYDSQCESDPSATPVAYQCTYYFPYNQTQAGTYYVLVKGNTAYSGVVLKATWDNYVAGDLGFKTTTYYVTEPTTGPASAAITVQRLHGSTGAVGLTLTTSNGTATAGSDYTATTQTVTWADGDSADKTVMIPILADAVFDSGETVNLKVGSYTGGAGVAGSGVLMDAVLTIIDNNAYLSYNTPRTISGAVNSQTLYAVTVPAGAQYLSITLTGPASAATAYVRYGEKPDTNGGYDSQCESDPSATPVAYQCTYYFPYNQTQAGTYYVLVKGNTAYSGVVLKATWDNYVAGDLGFKTTTYYVTEPTTGPASAAITVQRLHGSTGAVGLTLTTSNGTATAGSDYTATTQTVTWADGDSADKTVMIPILADAVFDSGETVNLKVGSYTGGAGVAGSGVLMDAVLTIIDNNAYLSYNTPRTISGAVNSQTLYAVTVPAGAQYLSITLTGPASAATAYVRYGEKPDTNGGYDSQCESDPSATPVAYQCTYYFPYNQTQAGTYYVLVKGNTAYSGVVLKATWDNYVAGDLGFKTTTYYVTEPTTGPASAAITVQRLHGSTGAVGLTLTTSNGTATAGSDYTATTQTVTWADGDSADKTVMIPILADAVFDSGETVNLKVGSYTGGAGVAGSGVLMDAVLTIIDNNAYLSYNTPRTISGAVNSQTLYAVTVPAGAQYLSITLTGPASAATAYVRYGEKPDTNGGYDSQCESDPSATPVAYQCTYYFPYNQTQAGTYYVLVKGNTAYSGVVLKATWTN